MTVIVHCAETPSGGRSLENMESHLLKSDFPQFYFLIFLSNLIAMLSSSLLFA